MLGAQRRKACKKVMFTGMFVFIWIFSSVVFIKLAGAKITLLFYSMADALKESGNNAPTLFSS